MLLPKILAYLEVHGLQESRFGRLAINDPNLVIELRRGRELRPSTIAKIETILASPPASKPRKYGNRLPKRRTSNII